MINCLHNLSRRIATVLQHEERRCQYLTREAKLILALQDEVTAMAEGEYGRHGHGSELPDGLFMVDISRGAAGQCQQ